MILPSPPAMRANTCFSCSLDRVTAGRFLNIPVVDVTHTKPPCLTGCCPPTGALRGKRTPFIKALLLFVLFAFTVDRRERTAWAASQMLQSFRLKVRAADGNSLDSFCQSGVGFHLRSRSPARCVNTCSVGSFLSLSDDGWKG